MTCYMVHFILLYVSLLEERQRIRRQKIKLNVLQVCSDWRRQYVVVKQLTRNYASVGNSASKIPDQQLS
jgi:predicted anti-sigma-YlaC factor YlaD